MPFRFIIYVSVSQLNHTCLNKFPFLYRNKFQISSEITHRGLGQYILQKANSNAFSWNKNTAFYANVTQACSSEKNVRYYYKPCYAEVHPRDYHELRHEYHIFFIKVDIEIKFFYHNRTPWKFNHHLHLRTIFSDDGRLGSWSQHGAHLGPVGPRWAPCWPHEPCYQGSQLDSFVTF